MGQRIISGARPHSPADEDVQWPGPRRSNMVIVDWGPTAELLVFPPDEQVACGAQFQYRGALWVITSHRRDSRILVAEPISH